MSTKKVTLTLTPEQQKSARGLSKNLFGKENISGYVGYLIEREGKKQVKESQVPTISSLHKLYLDFYRNASEDYRKEDAEDFCLWLGIKGFRINDQSPVLFFNNNLTVDTLSCYTFCREFENKIEITKP